jgi:hypothetical protein
LSFITVRRNAQGRHNKPDHGAIGRIPFSGKCVLPPTTLARLSQRCIKGGISGGLSVTDQISIGFQTTQNKKEK